MSPPVPKTGVAAAAWMSRVVGLRRAPNCGEPALFSRYAHDDAQGVRNEPSRNVMRRTAKLLANPNRKQCRLRVGPAAKPRGITGAQLSRNQSRSLSRHLGLLLL